MQSPPHPQYKKEYDVRLSGFPKHSVVTVQALRIPGDDDDDDDEEADDVDGEGEVLARPMATVSTDGEGKAAVRSCSGFVCVRALSWV